MTDKTVETLAQALARIRTLHREATERAAKLADVLATEKAAYDRYVEQYRARQRAISAEQAAAREEAEGWARMLPRGERTRRPEKAGDRELDGRAAQ